MSAPPTPDRDRLFDLLADRATEGLSEIEATELTGLLREHADVDPHELELVAASIDLALATTPSEPLPAALRARVEAAAPAHFATPGAVSRLRVERPTSAPRSGRGWIASGWLAAAAVLVLALILARTPEPVAPLSPTRLRAELLARASDAVVVEWTATGDSAGPEASGDVVWSSSRQEGYMRFRGLAANDPAREQYQLWIFDATRNEAHPVDGGVFDVAPADEDVVVPIRARVPVADATLFAVTVERPGGVVVSTRERLPVLAKVGT